MRIFKGAVAARMQLISRVDHRSTARMMIVCNEDFFDS
jgi:hypothetical protein